MPYLLLAAAHAMAGTVPGGRRVYQATQKRVGGLRTPRFHDRFGVQLSLASAIRLAGGSIDGARMMEVGTGRILTCPVGFYLLGVDSVDTFDITSYLDTNLNMAMLPWLSHNRDEVRRMFGSELRGDRLRDLLACTNFTELLECCSITIHCPASAANTGLQSGTIDLHISQNTFEHVSPPELQSIVREASRVLRSRGLACHLVDHSDHWAKRSSRHSSVHFLRYSDRTWSTIAGNSHAYHNRLRSSEVRTLFTECGLHEELIQTNVDGEVLRRLPQVRLNARYRSFDPEDLATADTMIVSSSMASRGSGIG